MKLKLAGTGIVVMLAAISLGSLGSLGCAPNAGAPRANGPADVLAAMEVELSHAIPGTTTLTSASLSTPSLADLPEDRGSLAAAERAANAAAAPAAPTAQTWGAEPAPQPTETKSIYEP